MNVNNTEKFIKKARGLYGSKYDYSKVEYVDTKKTKVKIICPIHGEFKQTPRAHYRGGCPKCSFHNTRNTQEDFIEKARDKHGDKYDYSKSKYTTQNEKVTIICPKHGEFTQIAKNHISGRGCRKCKNEKVGSRLRKDLWYFEDRFCLLYTSPSPRDS